MRSAPLLLALLAAAVPAGPRAGDPLAPAPAPQRDRIVPVVKERGWLEALRRALRERGKPGETAPAQVWEDYNAELLVFYAEDQPKNVRYLTEQDLRSLGLARKELRAAAVRNLLSIVPKIELHGRDGVFMVTAGGVHEASLILVDDLWDGGRIKVDGDVVVAIPARDLLLVCGSRDAAALAKVRQIAANAASESSYPLTPALFVRRGGTFRRLE